MGDQIFKLQAAAVCDKGKVRGNNEDNLIFDRRILKEVHEGIRDYLMIEAESGTPQLMGVFDGMGGHSKGEKASYMMAETAACMFDAQKPEQPEEYIPAFLTELCIRANEAVCEEMMKEKSRIGTTASMLYFYHDRVWVCNIGDSPVYRYRKNCLEEIYEEHTERVLWQKIYGEDTKGKKYPLTQHIGIFPDEMKIQPYTACMELEPGDQFIICSDGLTDMVSDETIGEILASKKNAGEKAERLKDKALLKGGRDNITVIVISAEISE